MADEKKKIINYNYTDKRFFVVNELTGHLVHVLMNYFRVGHFSGKSDRLNKLKLFSYIILKFLVFFRGIMSR